MIGDKGGSLGPSQLADESPLSIPSSQSDLQLSSTQSPHHHLLAQQHAPNNLIEESSEVLIHALTPSALLPTLYLCCECCLLAVCWQHGAVQPAVSVFHSTMVPLDELCSLLRLPHSA